MSHLQISNLMTSIIQEKTCDINSLWNLSPEVGKKRHQIIEEIMYQVNTGWGRGPATLYDRERVLLWDNLGAFEERSGRV